jgi:hypothetical protein
MAIVTDEVISELEQTIESIRVLYSTLWLDYMNSSQEVGSVLSKLTYLLTSSRRNKKLYLVELRIESRGN